jgi:hypothetical protein
MSIDRRILLPPDHPQAPKYWMKEIGGQLYPAIRRYLENRPEGPFDVSLIRDYLRQWIDSPVWDSDDETGLNDLRRTVRLIKTRDHITSWLQCALDLNIDPL